MSLEHIVLATGNKGKVSEFTHLFSTHGVQISPQSAFDVASVPETGTTFVENAIIKARHAAKVTGLPAIADDSGLVVEALDGAPGIYSSRFAGEDANDSDNIDKLLSALSTASSRKAHFYCCLVFMRHADDPVPLISQGYWHGEIATSRSGTDGFGYDPVFYLPEQDKTAAQLSKSEKGAISHRGKALAMLMEHMRGLLA